MLLALGHNMNVIGASDSSKWGRVLRWIAMVRVIPREGALVNVT